MTNFHKNGHPIEAVIDRENYHSKMALDRARQKCQKYLATVLISGHSAKILQNPPQHLRVRVSTLKELRGK